MSDTPRDRKRSITQSDFYLLPNILTISRVSAIPLMVIFLYWEWNLASLIVFAASGISDYVDGWVARRYRYESKLGVLLDPLADKLIVVSTMIMLLWLGRLDIEIQGFQFDLLGPILVIVTVGREIAITGLRVIASSIGIGVPVDQIGKIKTWVQFFAIALVVSGWSGWLELGQALLCLSVVAALWSGAGYTFHFVKNLPES